MTPSQLAAAFYTLHDHATVEDPGSGGTYDLSNKAYGKADVSSAGNRTHKLPDDGTILLSRNATGSGTLTINDSDGNAVASVVANETALCFRVGDATNNRWHAVILKMGAT